MRTRTKDKIRTIRAASDGQGHIEIKRTEVLDGAEYRIDNWRQVSRALGLIIKDQLMLASADESAEQYISEMIATRGDTADGTLLLQRDSFTQFTNYVDAYTSEPMHHGRNSHNQSFAVITPTVVRIVAANVRFIPQCVHEPGGRAVRRSLDVPRLAPVVLVSRSQFGCLDDCGPIA